MTHRLPVVALLAGLFVQLVALGVEPLAFPFQKELTRPGPASAGIGGVIFDDEILSELNARRTNLRLLNDADQEAPFLVRARTTTKRVTTDWITFVQKEELPEEDKPVLRTIDFSAFRQDEDPKNRQTLVYFNTRRQPLVTLTLLPGTLNFSRRVTVAATDDDGEKPRWTNVVSATISRIEAGPVHQEQLKIPLNPARRYRHVRVTIENQDNPPLNIASVQAEAEVWEVLFFQQAPQPRRLLYGGASDEAPQFDIGTVLSSVPGKEAQMWSLGAEAPNPAYKPARQYWMPRGKYILVAAILAMALLLVRLIARTAKHLDDLGGSSANKEG